MSYIEELRQRVETAERRFGLIDEQERRYSERLIGLMDALEAAQGEKQAEAASHQARIAVLERENGELRGMLHALLLGVEAGGRDGLASTLRDLDSRLSGLLGAAPADATEMPEAAAETPGAEAPATEELPGDESFPEAGADSEEDAVTTAGEAVAALIGDDALAQEAAEDATIMDEVVADLVAEGTAEGATLEIVLDEIAVDRIGTEQQDAEQHDASGAASPVADMIDRLADETQDFPEPGPEAAGGMAAEEPTPASEAVRKQA